MPSNLPKDSESVTVVSRTREAELDFPLMCPEDFEFVPQEQPTRGKLSSDGRPGRACSAMAEAHDQEVVGCDVEAGGEGDGLQGFRTSRRARQADWQTQVMSTGAKAVLESARRQC